ncbi:MBL fold metallo-hydrolase [Thermophagus sp. OGC60D27]|uniref:MBL fold metallo-hydrolase n=1 Tax=Thermophagus sp. OGC60D27 TaxID=3458415 RepID=UPI0040380B92
MLHIEPLVFNPFQENTLIVYTDSGECAIVDPGMLFDHEEARLVEKIAELKVVPRLLLQTHLHVDHVLGTRFVSEKYGLDPMAHEGDEFLIGQTKSMAASFGMAVDRDPPVPAVHLNHGDRVELGATTFEVIHVPGHSPGGIAFYSAENKVLLAGDILFKGSVGRSDLPGGNHKLLIDGIKSRLMVLPDDVVVYPGHGPKTTIGEEKRTNPFLC